MRQLLDQTIYLLSLKRTFLIRTLPSI